MAIQKFADINSIKRFWSNIKPLIDAKSDNGHTHDRVNGYKIVVQSTTPTTTDNTIITFVK